MTEYEVSIGMEVHAELRTRSKMFCRCEVAFGGHPNTRVCPVCLGMPGTLPVPNALAIEMVIRTALALDCKIAYSSVFHRKNYFYPDLPKGYQISQYGEFNPLGHDGKLDIPSNGGTKSVRIRRVHLEEDTGKLLHLPSGESAVDFNRAGTPLMEIVTDFPPDLHDANEAKEYLMQLRALLLYLGVCDGKMEEGSLRCEPNVSVRRKGDPTYGPKTELKNLNSFRSVQLGVQYEIERQIQNLERGVPNIQETRGWNELTLTSFPMRMKEGEEDYRYFPDPDLAQMQFDAGWVEGLRQSLPELPLAKAQRYQRDLGLSAYDAGLLVADRAWAEFFEQAVELGGDPKTVCNWMNSEFAKMLNQTGQSVGDEGRTRTRITPEHLVELIALIDDNVISGRMAKDVFATCFQTGEMPKEVVQGQGLGQISDVAQLESIVQTVLAQWPEAVEQFRAGKSGVKGHLIGQVMRATDGKANPQLVAQILDRELVG
jgi:aspartyl-tRNA(Asn)/glutamyl-tRNA(Gln) amidotransferase subunit B